MKATIITVIVIVALAAGNIYAFRENGQLSESITTLNGTIKTQKDTIEDLQGDVTLRQQINDDLTIEKLDLMKQNFSLLEENKRILAEGPKIVETVKVIENVKYVQLDAVESKVNRYYLNLYTNLGAK